MFDRDILLQNQNKISEDGIEDFIADAITNNYISNSDTFINLDYLVLDVQSHTTYETSVSNVENGIYNLHTWMTNCTQYYNITYSFDIDKIDDEYKLVLTIKKENPTKEIIDVNAQPISNYEEVFETDVTAKVTVKFDNFQGEPNPRSLLFVFKN